MDGPNFPNEISLWLLITTLPLQKVGSGLRAEVPSSELSSRCDSLLMELSPCRGVLIDDCAGHKRDGRESRSLRDHDASRSKVTERMRMRLEGFGEVERLRWAGTAVKVGEAFERRRGGQMAGRTKHYARWGSLPTTPRAARVTANGNRGPLWSTVGGGGGTTDISVPERRRSCMVDRQILE
jgi:hypothetical protein